MQYVFQVSGMTCGHCERAVTEALQSVDDQARIRIDRSSGRVEVETDRADEAALHAAIREEGYTVVA